MKNSNCNQIKIFINLEIIGEEKLYIYIYIYVCVCVCGPILPCVQTVWEEARPNTILIRTNEAGKGPAQYPV